MKTTIPAANRALASLEDRIRERAYYLWIERGCPHGEDWEHWFTAKKQLSALGGPAGSEHSAWEDYSTPSYSIRKTAETHGADPKHRFHAPGTVRDRRLDVIASEARQRVRARHFGGKLRAEAKSPT